MQNLLIYRLGSLGDSVVALPCLNKIAECYPHANRVILTNVPVSPAAPRAIDVLGASLVHDAIEYRVGTRSVSELADLWVRLRRLRADTMVYLTPARGFRTVYRDLAFFRSLGIRTIIGAPVNRDLLENRIEPKTGFVEYEGLRLARCLAALGPIDLDQRSAWDLHLTRAEQLAAAQALAGLNGRKFIAINMGGKARANDWGHANWSALLTRLCAKLDAVHFVFLGSGQDAERAAEMCAGRTDRTLNLCGRLLARETAAVLSKATLFAGHDSGPMHLAAACGVACVGLFSNLHRPGRWHPYGQHHTILHPSEPISSISVEHVYDSVVQTLKLELAA